MPVRIERICCTDKRWVAQGSLAFAGATATSAWVGSVASVRVSSRVMGSEVGGGGGWGPQVRGAQDSPAPSHPNTSTSRPQEQPSGRPHHRMDHTPTPHFGRTVPPSATTPKPAVALGALTPLDGTRPYHRQYCLLRAGSRACLRVENVRCRTARRRSNSHGSEPVAKVHPARFVLYRAVWTPAFAGMTWLTCGGISLLRR